ncbi:MAG TPA: inosine monophosphate cyclohydrolase [Clostridiaceae bacterium]|nr:inosine monophosphate cyclohydrolase [Clostridiaceae bacterium]
MLSQIAAENAKKLAGNKYPGRGIVLGASEDRKKYFQIYWIMGRSENSRNRVFVEENGFVRTKAYDESKLTDPSLIIYYPLKYFENFHIISNGDQTDTVYEYLKSGKRFEDALMTRTFEPDEPNYTPRITGLTEPGGKNAYCLSILKTQNNDPATCIRNFYYYENPVQGIGHCIHTYDGDGKVLPPFSGEPYVVPIPGSIDEVLEYYWELLDPENRISILVKTIDTETGKTDIRIKNRHG